MEKVNYLVRYLSAYFGHDTRALREEAARAARDWMVSRGQGSPHFTDAYQNQVSAYARAYADARLHALAAQSAGAPRV